MVLRETSLIPRVGDDACPCGKKKGSPLKGDIHEIFLGSVFFGGASTFKVGHGSNYK